ncbi:hypothetical protein GBA63_15825 [Rubrobacter tropicus]|uniref:Uncharacterized protein n=1 Tax=Rubrobacter tropicus TaxID=2653851 RepID=A0A6G8QC07_9ACTN|nr:hypothetical protein [Rubrobacter tropicus]QIN83951.1 hypothetical protein GBA63_15825 [Rubrobacter tropicus]
MIRNEARRDPYRTLVEAAIKVQERNVRVTVDMLDMLTGQAGATRAFLEHLREQQEAFWALAEGSFKTCLGLPHDGAPEGEAPSTGHRDSGLPVEDFDRLGVEELGRKLEGLCARDVERLKDHERRTGNRRAVMERLDRALV